MNGVARANTTAALAPATTPRRPTAPLSSLQKLDLLLIGENPAHQPYAARTNGCHYCNRQAHRRLLNPFVKRHATVRKRDKDDITEEEAVLEMYKEALGM